MDRNIKKVVITCPEGYEVDYEHSTFECIKFKPIKKELPKTWEEFCKTHSKKAGEALITLDSDINTLKVGYLIRNPKYDKYLLPSKEYAEAVLALCQLIQIRDYYNGGWEPDWTNSKWKFCLTTVRNKIVKEAFTSANMIMSFKSKELRDTFLENFKDLIETAKPLL